MRVRPTIMGGVGLPDCGRTCSPTYPRRSLSCPRLVHRRLRRRHPPVQRHSLFPAYLRTILMLTAALLSLSLAFESPALAGSSSGGITLHVQLDKPRQAEISDAEFPAGKVYIGETVSFSAVVTDVLSGEPLEGAVVSFTLMLDVRQAPAGYSSDRASAGTSGVTGETGLASATASTARLPPGRYSALISGPTGPVAGREYEQAQVKASRALELWDTTALTLEVKTDTDRQTSVSGRLTTGHGVGLPLPVSIYVDGSHWKTVTASDEGFFSWTAGRLRGGLRTFKAVFRGRKYLDRSEATALHDPSLDNWKATFTAAKPELDLPDTEVSLAISLEGPCWPPSNPFTLALKATDKKGKDHDLGEVPASSQVLAVDVELPAIAGPYVIGADLVETGETRRNRLDVEPATVTLWTPTFLTLSKMAWEKGDMLYGVLTYRDAYGIRIGLPAMPVTVTRDGQPCAELTTSEGTRDLGGFSIRAVQEAGQTGSLDPGVYQAVFNPPPGSGYRPSVSREVRVVRGFLGWLLSLPPYVLWTLAALMVAAAICVVVWVVYRVRAARGRAARPVGDEEEPDEPLLPPEVIRTLPPREQVIHLYEWLVATVLGRIVTPSPNWGHWLYWRRLSLALPQARQPLRDFLTLYQEARYSKHPLAAPQAEEAWRLAGTLQALALPEGGSPG